MARSGAVGSERQGGAGGRGRASAQATVGSLTCRPLEWRCECEPRKDLMPPAGPFIISETRLSVR